MNTELTLNTDYETLAALTGVMQLRSASLPQLKVNREPVDDNNQPLPMGHFCVTQDEVTIYGEKALFRPYFNCFQYSEWSPSTNKFINKTILFKNFFDEALDMLGGLACGKINKKELDKCSAQEQLRQKNIKCNRLLYGTVTFPDTQVKDVPVVWRMGGSNFMAPEEALKAIASMKHLYFNHMLELTTQREKQGSTIYYKVNVSPQLKKQLSLDDSGLQTINLFKEVIDRENAYVTKCWKEAKQAKVKQSDDPLAALDLNDDISDL